MGDTDGGILISMGMNKILLKYIHHRNLLLRGQYELGMVIGNVSLCMISWLFFKDLLDFPKEYAKIVMPSIFVVVCLIQYLFGYFWDQIHGFDTENEWHLDRNPTLRGMRKRSE
jgi:hypothetical protein